MIDTTVLEKIDEDGDLTLRLKYTDDNAYDNDDDSMTGMSVNAENGEDGTDPVTPRWKPSKDVDFLVSSKHMQIVSPVLKETIRTCCALHLVLNDDVEAFRILLNIIHGRVRQVPLKVTLHIMRHIALIVRKYQMMEVVELYVKIWMKELPEPSSPTLPENILEWLCVCWVFELPGDFKRITRQAVWETGSKLIVPDGEDYVFPRRILDKIQTQRTHVISAIFFIVESIYEKCTHDGTCPPAPDKSNLLSSPFYRTSCDSMILGSLIKSALDGGLWPVPQSPYDGVVVQEVMQGALKLRIRTLCGGLASLQAVGGMRGTNVSFEDNASHGWNKSIKKAIEKREAEAKGLDLADFLSGI